MSPSIRSVRLRLTAWYIGVVAVIIGVFGAAIYTVIDRQMLKGIDSSLERTVERRTRLVLQRRIPTDIAQDSLLYERYVFVFDSAAQPFSPRQTLPWIQDFARTVLRDGAAKMPVQTPDGEVWLAYGKRFRTTLGRTYATIAVARNTDLRELYPSIVTGFIASAIAALLLIGVGGAALARKSTQPIERAFEQMRRFMGDAAHELKTPVAVLRARSDVGLQRERTDQEYHDILTGISAEAKRMGSLVENMLLLARADAGEWPVSRGKVFLDDVLLDAASAARALGAAKGVNVEVGALEETPVHGDPDLLRQLFLILLDNAVNFTQEGGLVTADVRRNGTRCKVTITDTGAGIPAQALPHIFDRFYRADPARSRAGAGLGLSIAQWIVDAHDAAIDVDSRLGKGTRIDVVFAVNE